RLQPAAIVHPDRRRAEAWCHTDADRSCLAAPPVPQHPADPGDVFAGPLAGKPRGGGPGSAAGCGHGAGRSRGALTREEAAAPFAACEPSGGLQPGAPRRDVAQDLRLAGSCKAAPVAVVERVPGTVEAVHLLDGLLPAHTADQHTIGGRDCDGAVASGPAADE